MKKNSKTIKGVEHNVFVPEVCGLINGRKDYYANEGMSPEGIANMAKGYEEMRKHFFADHLEEMKEDEK